MSDPVTTKAAGAVVQADRDAAADCLRKSRAATTHERMAIREGRNDDHPAVQAFARHRTSATADLLAMVGEARDHILEQTKFAQNRRQDGIDMGARIWRIALEDIAHESRTLLTRLDTALAGSAEAQNSGETM